MQRREFISDVLTYTLTGTASCGLSGCGTLIHAERNGQPHSNNIDWKVAALDGLGLLLFFVPGVIAFVVDFSTGAIYLPAEQSYGAYGTRAIGPIATVPSDRPFTIETASVVSSNPTQMKKPSAWKTLKLKRVLLSRERLQPKHLEEIVAHHTGQEISLDDTNTRLSKLASIDRFDEQLTCHRTDHKFGHTVRTFFSQLKPS